VVDTDPRVDVVMVEPAADDRPPPERLTRG
jgi:hypothetical protein